MNQAISNSAKSISKLETRGHFINGCAVADTGRCQEVFNPATGAAIPT